MVPVAQVPTAGDGPALPPASTAPEVAKVMAEETAREAGAEDLRQSRRVAIERMLAACGGNVSQAARRLGIHRSTIYRQLTDED